ncbi:MAG: hypothetical protein GYB53_11570 [Rhodobacteraceae bacterium]|nr:hypothetical protein [Paracoccaceae bacterium]MBR9820729.1 hypothetical protein [Paracoccaceae bacterium]
MEEQNPGDGPALDLFGNPIQPLRDRRGRPTFRKDKENQDFVAVRAAAGWSQAMIAQALGCDEKTLRKYFSRELSGGQLIVEGMCLDVLLRKVREGHAPSIRQLQERMDRVAAPPPPKKPGDDDKPEAPLGKKEQRLRDAETPADGYGDLYSRIHGGGRTQ